MAVKDFLVLLAVCFVWAANTIISKIVLSDFAVPPLFYTAGRMVVVAAVTLPWLLPAPRPLWRVMVVALLMGALNFGLSFIGLSTTTPSANAIVGQLGAPLATLLSILILGERIGWRRGLGVLLAFAGVLAVMWNGKALAVTPGLLWVAGSAAASALGAVLMKQIAGVKPLQFQAWVGFTSILPLALASGLTEHGQAASVVHAPLVFLAGVLFSALVVSVGAHTTYYWLIQRYEGTLLQPLTLISTLMTIALGVAITKDPFGARMAVGTVLALAGVLIIALRPNRAAPRLLAHRNRAF
ncbi:MAG: DMT family transporter [Caulobacteraceae bacterium]